jgi:hypothetical protein
MLRKPIQFLCKLVQNWLRYLQFSENVPKQKKIGRAFGSDFSCNAVQNPKFLNPFQTLLNKNWYLPFNLPASRKSASLLGMTRSGFSLRRMVPNMAWRRGMEIRYEMWNVSCEREVRVQLERARCRRKSGLKVEGVHWLRALVGALDSLAASEMVVWVQEGDSLASVRTKQTSGPKTDIP